MKKMRPVADNSGWSRCLFKFTERSDSPVWAGNWKTPECKRNDIPGSSVPYQVEEEN